MFNSKILVNSSFSGRIESGKHVYNTLIEKSRTVIAPDFI